MPDQDRDARMARVRENSPASTSYWARKLGFDPDRLTAEQLAEVKTARKAYFAELRTKSIRGIKHAQASRLRQRADAIDAEADSA
jgi:hypothetical protein